MRSWFWVLLALVLSGVAVQAKSDGIPLLKPATIPKGTTVVYERGNGSRFTVTFLGKSKLGYKAETREGASGKGPVFLTVYNDKNGRRLREERNGLTMLYKPHSCARILGRCDYSLTLLATGEERFFETNNKRLKNGDFEQRIKSGGTEQSRTRYRISEFFGLGASWILTPEKGPKQKGRLIEVRRP